SALNVPLSTAFPNSVTNQVDIPGLTIDGVPTWNFNVLTPDGLVTMEGPDLSGLQTLNYSNNNASLVIGTAGQPMLTPLSTINVSNDTSDPSVHLLAVHIAKSAITGNTLTVNATNVGSPNKGNPFAVIAGGNTKGYGTWNLNSFGGGVNLIALGTTGNSFASTLNLNSSAGNLSTLTSLFAAKVEGSTSGNWGGLTKIIAPATDTTQWILTGAELNNGAPHPAGTDGFLAGQVAAPLSIQLGASSGNFVDLTSMGGGAAPGLQLNLGTGSNNELDINSPLASTTKAFGQFAGIQFLGITNPGGTYNIAFFPGVFEIDLKTKTGAANPTIGSPITLLNVPNGLHFNFQDANLNSKDFSATGTGAPGTTFEIILGDTTGHVPHVAIDEMDHVVITMNGNNEFGTTSYIQAAVAGNTPTLLLDVAGHSEIGFQGTPTLGVSTVTLVGGTLLHPESGIIHLTDNGFLNIGITNAFLIDQVNFGIVSLTMLGPDNDITVGGLYSTHKGVNVTGNFFDLIQGAMGEVNLTVGGVLQQHTAPVGNDTLSEIGSDSNIYPDGGFDTVNLNFNGGMDIHFGAFFLNGDVRQTITDNVDRGYQGFWNFGLVAGGAVHSSFGLIQTTTSNS